MDKCDLLVIGIGAGGGACALRAADLGMQVIVITSSLQSDKGSNTSWAQGGIIYRSPDDSPELLAKDVHEAGVGISNPAAVALLSTRGPDLVRELLIERCQVPFDRTKDGELDFTEEAAHSRARIIHVEDATGRSIAQHLVRAVKDHPNITVIERAVAVDLIMRGHHTVDPRDVYRRPRCLGAYILERDHDRVRPIMARETVLATGGLGQIYLHTTNPRSARGDGLAMAYRAGARVINLEYVQFHPTALYHRLAPRFLLSESLRGEGARLVTRDGTPFMQKYHKLGDLAPRDVVARGIQEEMMETGEDCMYLDITDHDPDWIRARFPLIYQTCKSYGIDITKDRVPVVPAAHYACGGVAVDLEGRTNLTGLRAVGEVSCTGVHGANRLASTSLLEAITWGYTAAEGAARDLHENPIPDIETVEPWQMESEEVDPTLIQQDWATIKMTMWNYVGLVRTRKRLNRALKILRELQFEIESFYRRAKPTEQVIGLRNGVQTALAITHSAYRNRVSRGGHYRLD
ncbi:L-aspartate oxidase [bacterium]|nr:L-aspartate oxidase [bacterium]